MPFDTAASIPRAHSRASTMSPKRLSRPEEGQGDILAAAAPGVLSMLRTSTDTGDLGMLSVNQGRIPTISRQRQKSRHPTRLSDGSHRSAKAGRSIQQRTSMNGNWEGSSLGHRGSISSLQTTRTGPSVFPSDGPGLPLHPPPTRGLPPNPSPAPSSVDQRAYSLTQGRTPHTLLGQRSVSSLRSQGTKSRMHMRGPPTHQTRPPRPGYRSVSPALSDYHASRGVPPSSRYMHRPPMPTYNSDYGYVPPPPPLGMRLRYPPMPPPPGLRPMYPPLPTHGYEAPQYMYSGPPSSLHPAPAHHRHAVMYGLPLRSDPHPQYAMPPRSGYTPGLDATPPSSGPDSSAPHSSNPSTPQDNNNTGPLIDPEFIDPQLSELQEENSEQAAFSGYIAYTNKAIAMVEPPMEIIEELATKVNKPGPIRSAQHEDEIRPLPVEDMASPPPTDATPPPDPLVPSPLAEGLVSRMLALLENKNSTSPPHPQKEQPASRKISEHHLRREATVAELPATPVKPSEPNPASGTEMVVSEKETVETVTVADEVRITRELVRATLAPSSSEHETLLQGLAQLNRVSQQESIDGAILTSRRTSSEYPSNEVATAAGAPPPPPPPPPAHVEAMPGVLDESSTVDDEDGNLARSSEDEYAVRIHLPSGKLTEVPPEEARDARESSPTSAPAEDVAAEDRPEVNVPIESEMRASTMPGQFPVEACEENGTDLLSPPLDGAPGSDFDPASQLTDDKHAHATARPSSEQDDYLDSNAGVTSDIVTNVAVRFSIPKTTSMTKASIFRVSSLPEHHTKLHKSIHELPETASPRGSVCQTMETIAPLQIVKSDKQDQQTRAKDENFNKDDGTDLSSFIRRSFPRRQSAFLRKKLTKGGATDGEEKQKPQTLQPRLPNVQEASGEDLAPSSARQATDRGNTLSGYATGHPESTRQMTLSEIRDLPSLNFSQMDLIDQLNAALNNRDRQSVDLIRKRLSSNIVSPSPMRPSSTEALRERYTSFFAKPDDLLVPEPAEQSTSIMDSSTIPSPAMKLEHMKDEEPAGHDDQHSEQPRPSTGRESRPLSPTELLGVAHEANRLDIPSVDGLSYRISEMLPSLKRLHLNSTIADDKAVKQTLDDIHRLGERPDTMLSMRSSGVLRSLAAIADDIATNGTHASQHGPPGPRFNKSLPPLPRNAEDTMSAMHHESEEGSGSAATSSDSNSQSTVKPELRRTLSESDEMNRTSGTFLEPGIFSPARRSLTVSAPNSRPWNFDDNYPWSLDTAPVDVNFNFGFSAASDRDSIASHILRAKAMGARGSSASALDVSLPHTLEENEESSPADVSELEPTATVTADTLTRNRHQRVLSKKAASILGSISRRAKMSSPLRPSFDGLSIRRPGTGMSGALSRAPAEDAEIATIRSATTSRSKGRKNKAVEGIDRSKGSVPKGGPHTVGDRYPTTALTPPMGYDLDEIRSYFSDDADSTRTGVRSRASQRAGSRGEVLRKRLSGLSGLRFKPSITVTRPASDASWGDWQAEGQTTKSRAGRADGGNRGRLSVLSRASGSGGYGIDRDGSMDAGPDDLGFGDGLDRGRVQVLGAGRVQLGVKRVVDKVRAVLGRGGRLLRRVSGRDRKRKARDGEEWLGGGSMYSGT